LTYNCFKLRNLLFFSVFGSSSLLAQDATELDLISIESSSSYETANSEVQGYKSSRSASATRTDTAISDVPQAISVVPAQIIDDLASSRVDAALDFAGGVARGNNFGGLQMFGLSLRGFSGDSGGFVYYNGFATRGTNAPPDVSAIERLEVLKGPTAGLYGAGDPGGVINIVSKRPQHKAFTKISLTAGKWDKYYSTIDVNTPLNANIAARLIFAAEDNGSFRDYVGNKRYVITPILSADISDSTHIIWHNEFSRTDLNLFDRGVFPINGNWRAMNKKTYLGEPNDGRIRTDTELSQLILEHSLNADWLVRLAGQYRHGALDGNSTEPMAPILGSTVSKRRYRERDFTWRSSDVHLETVGHFSTLDVHHTLLAGLEYSKAHSNSNFPQTNFVGFDIDAINPIYAGTKHPGALSNRSYYALQENYAFNVQDQIEFTPKFGALIGARFDKFKVYSLNRVNPIHTYAQTKHAFVPRAGLMYKFTPQVSSFVNAAKSFKPNLDENANYKIYDPITGIGYEAGFKLDLIDEQLAATLALFQIEKKNVLRTLSTGDTADSGKEQSKGFDAQIAGKVSEQIELIAAYAYIKTEVKQGSANTQGSKFANVPTHNLSVLSWYQINDNFKFGAQINHVGTRASSEDKSVNVPLPKYETFNLLAQFKVNQNVGLKLNFNNVFNREYFERGGFSGSAMTGDPRHFTASLNLTF